MQVVKWFVQVQSLKKKAGKKKKKKIKSIRLAARKYARIVQKLGFKAKFSDFKIQNIVGSCDVGFPIRLEGLVCAHGHFSSVLIFFIILNSFFFFSMNLNYFQV